MATITSVGTGAWSAAGTWDSGVPVDGDDVVISAGHTVTFDADQSAFTTGVKITITGTLNHALTGGPYTMFLKTGASLVGAGTWNVGTEANPIPFAVKHTITGASGWYVDGLAGLTMTVYGAEPSIKYVKLSGTEAIGQTELSVDTDVTGDIWTAGDTILTVNKAKANENKEYTIAAGGIASGAITISSALTAQLETGSHIALVTRNVKFQHTGTTNDMLYRVTGLTIGGGLFYGVNKYIIRSCTNATISGGVITYGSYAIMTCTGLTLGACVICRNDRAISDCDLPNAFTGTIFLGNNSFPTVGFTLDNCYIAGISTALSIGSVVLNSTITDFTSLTISYAFIDNSTISYGNWGVNAGYVTVYNSTFGSDNTNIATKGIIKAYNTLFNGKEPNLYQYYSQMFYSESIDHDQVAGAYKAWTKGGVTTKQAVTYPTGFTNSMQTVLESATSEGYWQKELSVGAGQSVNITSYLRKDSSMTYLPRVIMFLKNTTDPFAGGTGLHTFTMTDSVDTWEDDTYTYSNDTSEDVVLVIRTQGKNATGNLFSYLDIEIINVDLTSALALLNSIKAETALILADTGTTIPATLAGLATSAEVGAITMLDEVVVGSYTMQDILKILASAMAGKVSGGGTSTITFRGVDDASDVIVATVDASGNRSALTITV